ncbi:molybdopterin converting factor subunit 1 [Hahella sp. SMD15-11]|uniref:Molybdopterin synthase sulfur carrier subunit n=1 Tax=Thermohahella caldifontis TaxID=3142973 RepID=A0AB39UX07_9GAMM
MIEVLFFARFRETLGTDRIALEADGLTTLADVLAAVKHKLGEKAEVLEQGTVLAAVNQEMSPLTAAVKAGDEVAFFPPVTGG